MLTLNELRDYNYWLNKSPVEVRDSAIKAGGWAEVFPREFELKPPKGIFGSWKKTVKTPFPEWASRVRNFFNLTPRYLKLLPREEGYMRILNIKDRLDTILPGAHQFALSGHAYVDESQRPWFQMSTAATIYHYVGDVNFGKKADAFLSSQIALPVFKLISPDDTGGSMELVVLNPKIHTIDMPVVGTISVGERTIGTVGEFTPIGHRTELHKVYRGSYNYAETVIRGLDEHEYRDVDPHEEYDGFYVNPEVYSSLESRRFRPL